MLLRQYCIKLTQRIPITTYTSVRSYSHHYLQTHPFCTSNKIHPPTLFSRTPSHISIHTHTKRRMSANQYEKPTNDSVNTNTPLVRGSKTRFLSADYPIPFEPLPSTPALSFNDTSTWPSDPMRVFSQWYADGELAYNKLSPQRMDAPAHWPNTMQIATASASGFPNVRTVLLKGFDARGLIFFTNYTGAKGSQLIADPRVAVVFYSKILERQIRVQGYAEKLPEAESDAYFHSRPIGSQISGTVSPQSRVITSHTELEEHYVTTVQTIAQQVESLLAGATSTDEEQVRATKERVSTLLAALAEKKNAVDQVASPSSSSSSATPSTPSAEESARALAAHQVALASLERLDSSPLTAPLLRACIKRPSYWGGFLIRPTKFEFWCDGAFRLHSRIVYEAETGLEQRTNKNTTEEVKWNKKFLAP